MTSLTPQQAAKKARVSRGTIMNAINDKKLMARRDNRNRWQITHDDLSNWLSDRTNIITDSNDIADRKNTASIDEKLIRIAMLEAEVKTKDQRICDLEQERDARLEDKDKQIDQIRRDKDEQIAEIKGDRDRWSKHAMQIESSRPRRRWWPF